MLPPAKIAITTTKRGPMLRLLMHMILAGQCSLGLATTDEIKKAMDEALAKGWQPAQKPPENAPLAPIGVISTPATYLSSIQFPKV
jgi:hypothetical protein